MYTHIYLGFFYAVYLVLIFNFIDTNGRQVSDFFCTDAKDMHYKELSDKVRHYKETEEGESDMCDILDEMRQEAVQKAACENAKKMINDGALSFEKIAEYSGLSLEKVRELAGNKSA